MSFREYNTFAGELWRIERGDELCRCFEITGDKQAVSDQLAQWHAVVAQHEGVWRVLRMRYAIYSRREVCDPEDMVPRETAEIARVLGCKPTSVDEMEDQARLLWRRRRVVGTVKQDEKESEELPEIPPAEQRALLRRFSFPDDLPEEQRLYLAQRIRDVSSVIEADNLRSAVRSLLQSEMNLHFSVDPTIRVIQESQAQNRALLKRQNVLLGQEDLSPLDAKNARTEIDRLQSAIDGQAAELAKWLGIRQDVEKGLINAMDKLGIADLAATVKRKLRLQHSLGGMVAAMQEYYKNGNRELIDGVHTEAEVELLVKDYDIRPAQYRFELPSIVDASIERLLDPEFKLPPLPRKAHRRIRKAFEASLQAARAEDGEEQEELLENLKEDADEVEDD